MAKSAEYTIYPDADGEWRWNLETSDEEIIAASQDSFPTVQECHRQIKMVKEFCDSEIYVEEEAEED